MHQSNLCPCGKDVTDRKFAYHKYRCPLGVKRSQSAQSHSSGAMDPLLPNKTESQDSFAFGNGIQKKPRPRTAKLVETQSAQSHSSGAMDLLLPNKTESQDSFAFGNGIQKKPRPRTAKLVETQSAELHSSGAMDPLLPNKIESQDSSALRNEKKNKPRPRTAKLVETQSAQPHSSGAMDLLLPNKTESQDSFAFGNGIQKKPRPRTAKLVETQSAQSHSSGAMDLLLPNKTESQDSFAFGNGIQKKPRPRTAKLVETQSAELHSSGAMDPLLPNKIESQDSSALRNEKKNKPRPRTAKLVETQSAQSHSSGAMDPLLPNKTESQDSFAFRNGIQKKARPRTAKLIHTQSAQSHNSVAMDPLLPNKTESQDSPALRNEKQKKPRPRTTKLVETQSAQLHSSEAMDPLLPNKTESQDSSALGNGKQKKGRIRTAKLTETVPGDLEDQAGSSNVLKGKTKTAFRGGDKVPDDPDDSSGGSFEGKTSAETTRPASSGPGSTLSGKDIIDTRELDDLVDQMVKENVIRFSDDPNRDVNKFFDDEVKMTQCDITNVQVHFNKLREKILGRLNCETELGGWDYRNGGSHADGTKVARPDEMDCILYPRLSTKLQAVIDGSCQPGFCKVKVEGTEMDEDLRQFCDGEFLNSRKFRSYVFEKLKCIVENDRKLTDIRKYSESLSFAIKYTGIPTETGMKSIDMDFVPSVHISQWPRGKVARDISTMMPDKDKAQKIKSYGFNATPKQCFAGPKEIRDLLWQVSFSYAEKQLTKHADKNCWKPVLRTVKRVVEIAIGNSEFCARSKSNKLEQITKAACYARENYKLKFESRFTTYHIRTLMWTLLYELSAGEHTWTVGTKATKLRFTLEKLRKMLTGEMVVPHFFLPEVENIMCGVRSDERKFLYIIARATEIIFSKKS